MENTFKSSVFGGFNRDDVIRYIEKTALETKQRMDELEKEIDGLCRENANLRRDAGSAADARDRLSDSYYNLIEEQKAVKKELEQAQQETLSLQEQLSSLEEEKSSLLARIAQLQQQVDEYNTVKAHISDIEFSARQRADELEASTRCRLAETLDACRKQCDLVLSTLGTTCANVSGELRKLDASVTQLPAAFNTLRTDLEELENLK